MPYGMEPEDVTEVGALKPAVAAGACAGVCDPDAVTIRRARPGDGPALARLAALDSVRPLAGDLLLAEVEGEPWAALSLDDGRVVSDPFRPAAAARALLVLRADHLAAAAGGRGALATAAARPLRLARALRLL